MPRVSHVRLTDVIETIVQAISNHANELIATWGQENVPPPAHIYSVKNTPDVGMGGLYVVQKIFQGDFEFDILYNSKSAPEKVTSPLITEKSNAISASFNSRFETSFPLKAPFTTPRHQNFAKQALSSLLGGISYFSGSWLVDRSTHSEYDEEDEDFWTLADEARRSSTGAHLEGPAELFTATPSRPFFPRGFYWDEGFHLLPIRVWDNDLSLEIMKSCFGSMDEDGWIAREQI